MSSTCKCHASGWSAKSQTAYALDRKIRGLSNTFVDSLGAKPSFWSLRNGPAATSTQNGPVPNMLHVDFPTACMNQPAPHYSAISCHVMPCSTCRLERAQSSSVPCPSMYTDIHTYTFTVHTKYMHAACIHTYKPTYDHTCIHKFIHTFIDPYWYVQTDATQTGFF